MPGWRSLASRCCCIIGVVIVAQPAVDSRQQKVRLARRQSPQGESRGLLLYFY